jgi:hypothetical protein
LDARVVSANERQPREQVIDLGGYRQVVIQARIMKPGSAGNLLIEDAAVNEEDAFGRAVATFSVVNGAPPAEVTAFLRFLRWRGDANVAGSPVMIVDIVAKE